MIDRFFIQLDEYGNKLTKHSERQEALGKIKAYTGSDEIQIRAMRQDGFNYKHRITFISTANSNPLPIENEDRRILYIKTPNKLSTQEWVINSGGIAHVYETIFTEIMDFCYFLATEVENLKLDDYVQPLETPDKDKLILDNMPAIEQIAYYVKNSNWDAIKELALECGITTFDETWEVNKLQDEKLQELYTVMTEGNGSPRVVVKMMKDLGHSRLHSTKHGSNVFYYLINELHNYKINEVTFKEQFKEKKEVSLDG